MTDKRYKLSGTAIARLEDKLRKIPAADGVDDGPKGTPANAMWVQLTGWDAAGKVYLWTMQAGQPAANCGLGDRVPALSGSYAHDAAGGNGSLVGQRVRIYPMMRDSVGNLHWVFAAAGAGGVIAVSLTADAGGNGDATHTPNYSYKWPVNLATGGEILKADGSRATGLSPVWARNIGEFNQATHGTLYMGSDGNPVLYQVAETEQVCT